jgi:hypothetical protein
MIINFNLSEISTSHRRDDARGKKGMNGSSRYSGGCNSREGELERVLEAKLIGIRYERMQRIKFGVRSWIEGLRTVKRNLDCPC